MPAKQQLNPAQQAAIQYNEGPLLVIAGAGSGKTRVITQKIIHLITKLNVLPEKIAAITFTNKAAQEMRHRIKQETKKKETKGLTLSTFHSLGLKIIRQHSADIGYRPNFTIFDQQDSLQLIKEHLGTTASAEISQEIQWQISQWKNDNLSPEETAASICNHLQEKAHQVYLLYQASLQRYNAVDFDDLILLPTQLLSNHPTIQTQWQNKLRFLLVDEYQDTNSSQYKLIQLLNGKYGSLTVVGDDDQSIYGWRGAKPENIDLLQKDNPELKIIKLEQNYRSTNTILTSANTLIANNPHNIKKNLWSQLGEGDNIKVLDCENETDEAEKIIGEILHANFSKQTDYKNIAILYRSNHQSKHFEKQLRHHRINYELSGGTAFFDRSEIKDIMAYLRLVVNPDDDAAFLRIINTPRREIGNSSVEKIAAIAQRDHISLFAASFADELLHTLPPNTYRSLAKFTKLIINTDENATRGEPIDAVYDLVEEIHYNQWLIDQSKDQDNANKRIENVKELINWLTHLYQAPDKSYTLSDLLAEITLQNLLDQQDKDDNNTVKLMTLHAAKGLEFSHVFLTGFEEGILPHQNSIDNDSIAEERRLAYVGITRAKQKLYISYCNQRKRYGELSTCEPSRFLDELPKSLLDWNNQTNQASSEKASAYLENLRSMFNHK